MQNQNSSLLGASGSAGKDMVQIELHVTLTGLLWDTNPATWLTFYCFGTSCENTLSRSKRFSHIHEVIIKSGLAKCSVHWSNAKQVIPYSLFWQYLISFFAYMPDCVSHQCRPGPIPIQCHLWIEFVVGSLILQKQAFDISKF